MQKTVNFFSLQHINMQSRAIKARPEFKTTASE